MDIKVYCYIFVLLLFSCTMGSDESYKYYSNKNNIIINSVLDSSFLESRSFIELPNSLELSGYDTLNHIRYRIRGGDRPISDWEVPFSNYTYDTAYTRTFINSSYQNPEIYFLKTSIYRRKKFIISCFEQKHMGITVHSDFYSDTMNIFITTTFINQFDYSKLDIQKHFKILKNTEVYQKE